MTPTQKLAAELDALPLPVPTHFRNGVLYAFSADQIRAAHREGYELAMREAQEGREPVARVELMTTGGNVGIATRIVEIDDPLRERLRPGALLYDSPPPKSDEAMDALIKAARWFADNPDSPKSALGHITEALAALAAQQKGNK